MTANNLWGADQALDVLDRLTAALQRCAARADELEREAALNDSRVDWQAQKEIQDLDARLAASLAGLDSDLGARREGLESRRDRRQARLLRALASARQRHLKQVESREGREIFEVQRRLLDTGRQRESGAEAADQALARFEQALAGAEADCARLVRRVRTAFRGYAAFRRALDAPGEPAAPLADENRALEELQLLVARTEVEAKRFRLAPLPLLFSLLPPWPLAGLLAALHAAAVLVLPGLGVRTPALTWPRAGVSLAASWIAVGALHALGRILARRRALALADDVRRARALSAACAAAGQARHRQETERLRLQAETGAETLHQRWNRALEEGEQLRKTGLDRLDEKSARAAARNERLFRLGLERAGRDHESGGARLRADAAAERHRIEEGASDKKRQFRSRRQDAWQALETEWAEATGPACAGFTALQDACRELFPGWQSSTWENWRPPPVFAGAAPFALAEVDVDQLAAGPPRHRRLALPGPARFEVPLLLTCSGRGSILVESDSASRRVALATLNNLVLRFLSVAPAGRAVFTLIDPQDLGQSFAGLMHLADHEDRLVNRRIWTQPEQIEQRLAELNEHIESVTQLCLRHDYATLAEYNAQAGRIAESYHFVAIADFPAHFSDLALRRLLSIATGGPRCGVFLLVQADPRKIAGPEFEELRRNAVRLQARGERFLLARNPALPLRMESPPDPDTAGAFLEKVGRCSVDSHRVEMPFDEVAPEEAEVWSLDTAAEVRVAVGRSGASRLQHLALGKGTRQHALIAGKTGSGKSTLLHVIITNLALWCGPDQVEFYLVDFKKGVEFKGYAAARLPHARVVAIESDREFGLSVLERLDEELRLRGDLFRRLGVQDFGACRRAAPATPLPRTLLIIDEFQEFFVEDDRVSQTAALLLDRLTRQGRAFGIHVVLGSQTLGGAYTLARTTLGQMVVRIALQCSEADACLIMDDENPAPRLLSRPGAALYNDESGAATGNSPFQVVWIAEADRAARLEGIRRRAEQRPGGPPPAPVVFEGNAPADVRENVPLQRLLEADAPQAAATATATAIAIAITSAIEEPRVWLGAPNSIKGPTEIAFGRQSRHHLLVLGQRDESAAALLGIALVCLAAQHRRDDARFVIIDLPGSGSGSGGIRRADFLRQVVDALPHPVRVAGPPDVAAALGELAADLDARSASGATAAGPAAYLLIQGIQRFKALRYEDEFSLSADENASAEPPGRVLNRILTDGPHLGIHVLCTCDTLNNAQRCFSRKALTEFERRVLFQMSANDSATLIDTPRAAALGLHRALLQDTQAGTLETFRPYALPDSEWLDSAARHLARLAAVAT